MTYKNITIEYIPIENLLLLKKNPRSITKDQFVKLCNSIEEDPSFLERKPILVNHDSSTDEMIVYAGNQRVRAAKSLGWKEVPCMVDTDLDPEVIKKRIIKDNKTYGNFDWDILGNEYDDILLDCGFTEEELNFDNVLEVKEKTEKKKKKDKCMICPKCGFEIS